MEKLRADCFPVREHKLDMEAAIQTVEKGMRTQKSPEVTGQQNSRSVLEVFDELYACFYQGGSPLVTGFCTLLNESNQIRSCSKRTRRRKKQKNPYVAGSWSFCSISSRKLWTKQGTRNENDFGIHSAMLRFTVNKFHRGDLFLFFIIVFLIVWICHIIIIH